MQVTDGFHFVRSDYAVNFRNGLVPSASQFANIQVIPGVAQGPVKGFIKSIKVQSIQNLDWRIELHSRRLSQASFPFYSTSTPYYSSVLTFVTMDKALATRYATSFLYYRDGLNIPYLDEDGLGEMHVNLVNAHSGTAKLPGDSGAIHVAFGFVAAS